MLILTLVVPTCAGLWWHRSGAAGASLAAIIAGFVGWYANIAVAQILHGTVLTLYDVRFIQLLVFPAPLAGLAGWAAGALFRGWRRTVAVRPWENVGPGDPPATRSS